MLSSLFLRIIPTLFASSRGYKAAALSAYARRFGLAGAKLMHDYALSTFIECHSDGWQNPKFKKNDYFYMTLEAVAALRDRIEQLEERPHGAGQKVRFCDVLARQTEFLSRNSTKDEINEVYSRFSMGVELPKGERFKWIHSHYGIMEALFLHPEIGSSSIPMFEVGEHLARGVDGSFQVEKLPVRSHSDTDSSGIAPPPFPDSSLVSYAAQFTLHDAIRLHDLALLPLTEKHENEKLFAAYVDTVVALQDRCQELRGENHGQAVRSVFRMALVSTIKAVPVADPDCAQPMIEAIFRIGKERPDETDEWLNRHLKLMEQIYLDHPLIDFIC